LLVVVGAANQQNLVMQQLPVAALVGLELALLFQ
jgi:hypothetical protein